MKLGVHLDKARWYLLRHGHHDLLEIVGEREMPKVVPSPSTAP